MARQHTLINAQPSAWNNQQQVTSTLPSPVAPLTSRFCPSAFAEQQGKLFANTEKESDHSILGQFFTPKIVADFMANTFSDTPRGPHLRILDPGAGTGVLSCALIERISQWTNKPKSIELIAYEIDQHLEPMLEQSFQLLRSWLHAFDISLSFSINRTDFLLHHLDEHGKSKSLKGFDLIVSNPPFYKLSRSNSVANNRFQDTPNMYTSFMMAAASVLKEGGQLTFITPRSFASGLYFKTFRNDFFDRITPTKLHVFQSRNKAFKKDNVLQETIIFHGTAEGGAHIQNRSVRISNCDGLWDIDQPSVIDVPLSEVIAPDEDRVLHIPTDPSHREIIKTVKSWKHNLQSLGMDVSTGPIVPFRSREILDAKSTDGLCAPLLWLHNIKTMRVHWPLQTRKQQYVTISQESAHLLVPKENYIFVRRFSTKEEKRRLVAAPFLADASASPYVGIENHLNYIYRKNGTMSEIESLGVAAILNSSLLDSYFRIFNGNTQVSATELRNIPLPHRALIEIIGMTLSRMNEMEGPHSLI